MATVRGRSDMSAFFAKAPAKITKVIEGAAVEMAKVVMIDAKERCHSERVASNIEIGLKRRGSYIVSTVQVKGWWAFRAPWLEYGTQPHVIRIEGLSKRRSSRAAKAINRSARKTGSLVIRGKFVGPVVLHPGARPAPFLRPAFDLNQDAAIKAGQAYVTAHITKHGLGDPAEVDESVRKAGE